MVQRFLIFSETINKCWCLTPHWLHRPGLFSVMQWKDPEQTSKLCYLLVPKIRKAKTFYNMQDMAQQQTRTSQVDRIYSCFYISYTVNVDKWVGEWHCNVPPLHGLKIYRYNTYKFPVVLWHYSSQNNGIVFLFVTIPRKLCHECEEQYKVRRAALDLIDEGCFYEVAFGCHGLLARHKFLGSLEMNRMLRPILSQ